MKDLDYKKKTSDIITSVQVPLIRAFGQLKQACAIVNMKYGLDKTVGDTIVKATDEVMEIIVILSFDETADIMR